MKLKRFSVICMSILLSLSSSLLAFADVDDARVNGTGGGNIAQDSDEAYAARYNVYTENQGMRIYLVDKQGKTVSSFVDVVQYRPETIEQGLITQSNSGGETTAYYTQLYQTYKNFTGYLPRPKKYLYLSGTKFDSQGGKFNQNLQGDSLKGGKMYTYAQISALLDATWKAKFNTDSPFKNTQIALPILRDMSDYTLKGQGDLVREQLDTEVSDKSLDMNALGFLLNMKLPVRDERGNLISSEMESIITYKSTADRNLAGLENDVVKVAKERGYYVAIEPLHWAVLEIKWPSCPREAYRGFDLNAFACSTKIVYGTESTVYNYFYTDALNACWQDKGYNINEMFPGWMWGLGKYAFQLKESDAELGLSTIPQSWDKVTNQVDLQTLAESSRSVGYGLMLMKTSPSLKAEITANIIKVFRENGKVTDTKHETTEKKVYTVTDEQGYKYTENKKSDEEPLQNVEAWEEVEGSISTENTVTVDDSTKTIYILYDKSDTATKQLILHENELSYTYSLKDLVKNGILASIYDSVKSATQAGASRPTCGGHSCGDEDCSGGHTCNSDDKSLSDNIYIVSVKNDFDYSSSTAFIKDFVADESTLKVQGLATWTGGTGESYKAEPNADFLLYRDKAKDLVTLYPSKNDALLNDLNSLGISNISYKPSASRIEKESTSKYFTDNFVTDFVYAEDRNTDLTWNWVRSGSYGSHTESGAYSTETATGHSPQDANNLYSQKGNIRQNYFLGKANTATDAPQVWYGLGLENYSQNKGNSIASADLKFYPYFKMLYHAKGDNSTVKEVAVTSENISTMKVYNTVILGVKKNTLPNVNLDSTQWSTHARALKFLQNKQIKDKKSVLPGGAILNFDTLQAGNTELGIRLYLSCLPEAQVSAVAESSFNTSETQARQLAEAYKNQVKNVLEGYGLVQYAKAGFTTERKDLLKQGKLLEANKKVELGNRLFTTNSDSKYYLRQNGTGASRANLDVLNVSEEIHIYTVKADWDGQLWIEKDGLAITEKTKDLNTLLSNAEVDVLNKNTKLISNFYNCLDRTGGKDRQGNSWYNEAFDGVSVLVSDLRYQIGFNSDLNRSTVLDTLLQGVAQSKSDLYNFDETMLNNTLRTSCFLTTAKSTATEAEGKNGGYIGTVASSSTMQALNTSLSDVQYLMFSKLFYITNANVSDLN